ncbi:hypothetical protein [Nocardioides sp. GXQ0305]|uniref:hypothetical protein n=1 Tax=Nocardioides sp. GXQ0305 TaxID=3423912 RepID=UPI003D7DB34B
MRARRAVTLGVLVWMVVAVAGATLVWGVISRAGEGVSGGLDPVPSTDGGEGATAVGGRTLSASPSPSPSRSPSPPTSSDTSSPGDPGTAASASVTRTWQGPAGLVSATCEGTVIRHSGSSASSGYRIEVDDTGPDRVRVEFENDESGVRVEAECVDGTPDFVVDGDD